MQEARHGNGTRRTPRPAAGKPQAEGSPVHHPLPQKAMHDYQSGLQWMQQGKFEKARVLFQKLVDSGPPELGERARVYLVACERNARESKLTFGNTGEQYDYAISLLNTGYYEEAREQFEDILRTDSAADYAHYGLAILHSMTGQGEGCLDHLAKAIELNSQNRIQARSDSDFQDMADDPRFTELLYPEIS
ncbi:MAG TPA: tetratricopeptide repeat protein [Acidisarcina sp.]|nr:tetratricopeptide repeat protein [Acidisarcina sp.]